MKVSDAELYVKIEFGVSSKLFDIDNALKPFLDILQKKMLFNDNQIRKLVVNKTITKKGCEFIKFTIQDYDGKMDNNKWL